MAASADKLRIPKAVEDRSLEPGDIDALGPAPDFDDAGSEASPRDAEYAEVMAPNTKLGLPSRRRGNDEG